MKIVFFDRDGVINQFPGHGNYVTKVKEFKFLPGAIASIVQLTRHGYSIFIVSNQAGIGKGIYSRDKLRRINNYMLRHIRQAGGRINRAFYCTHRSDADCDCRKPRIGSVKRAMQLMKKPLAKARYAYFVGDDRTDIEAGHNAKCKTIFVLSGKNTTADVVKSWRVKPDLIAKTIVEATHIIINENTHSPRQRRRRS
ncbi:MAG TPA: HAD-IIIA family hydrolase [Candidatus Omnitrophota bacterium]|nr:HAD-IIIA family hydrolase [Candidatus Omnitrophota bacterium]